MYNNLSSFGWAWEPTWLFSNNECNNDNAS